MAVHWASLDMVQHEVIKITIAANSTVKSLILIGQNVLINDDLAHELDKDKETDKEHYLSSINTLILLVDTNWIKHSRTLQTTLKRNVL